MSDAPRVSVIVVLYNGVRYIDRCLRSVLSQGFPAMEVIVVDNGSTDDGPARVERDFPTVRLVRSGANLGYAGGINEGLRHATGRYIAPLNMDTEVEAGWLEPLVDFLERHPGVGAVTPLILIDQQRDRVNAMGGAIHVSGLSFCNGLGLRRRRVPDAPFPVPGVSGASYLIRRERLERMGGAPAHCFMGNDDVVLSWNLRMLGDDIFCVPHSVVYHRYHLTLDPDKLMLLERNRFAMLITSLEPASFAALLPIYAATETALLLYCLWKGPAWIDARIRAAKAVWTDRQTVLERRRLHQRMRGVGDLEVLRRLNLGLPWRQLQTLLGPTPPRD